MTKPKIFLIGFNKSGTKTFHTFFKKNGLRSAHHTARGLFGRKRFLGLQMENNVQKGKPILSGINGYDVYSDLIYLSNYRAIEAIKYYEILDTQNMGAFFIFNDRPVEDWIRSRKKHVGGPYGNFPERYANAMQVDLEDVPNVWTMQYTHHRNQVLKYFQHHPRFLHFPLLEKGAGDIVNFLKPHFKLDESLWKRRGDMAERAAIQAKSHGG